MQTVKQVFGLVVLIALALALVVLLAPPLAADLLHRDAKLVPSPDYRVQSADCRTYLFVVSFCEVDLVPVRGTGLVSQYSIVLGPTDGERVVPMRSSSGDGYLTNSFAQAHLWNRVAAFLIAALLLVAGIAGCVKRLRATSPAAGPR